MYASRKSRWSLTGLQVLLSAFFLISVVVPLIRMLANMTGADFAAIVTSNRFVKALVNSLNISLTATAISVTLAMALAWCVVRTGIKHKNLWILLFTLPMLIPSISHGMGLLVLFGSNGILTRLLNLQFDIYGFWGVVTGSVMYSFPVAFLMIADVLKYEDSAPYEAAQVLGISRIRQFAVLSFPYLRKPLICVVFSVFTLVVTDYGVPLMVGDTDTLTLPVMMYQDVIQGMDFGKGSVIGLVLLTPAVAAFLIDLLNQDSGNSAFVLHPFIIRENKLRDGFAYALCLAVSLFVLLPIGVFLLLTFVNKYPVDLSMTLRHIQRAMDMGAGKYLGNSLFIAVVVSLVGTVIGVTAAYFTARVQTGASRFLHLVAITSQAVPGLVLGLAYALTFRGSFLYNTLTILIMVNLVHFFASPYLMIYNCFHKLNENLEVVGATLGVSRVRVFFQVLLPQAKATIVEMLAYFFVNSMMTISAVSFLANSSTRPLSLLIPSLEDTMMRESMAFVSLMILGVNLMIRLVSNWYKKRVSQ